jgi:tripeptide aminopeptidase
MKDKLLNRFITYVKINTQSDERSIDIPSTRGQLELGELLRDELIAIGMKEVKIDKFGYVTALLPSNIKHRVPVLAFFAHMDTSPDMSGKDVNPKVIENYDGQDILLEKSGQYLKTSDFPEILGYQGQTLITTDGTTLLGADDKAGISEIVTAMEYLIMHPEIEHGDIKIAFTTDEEIGKGVDNFNVDKFAADYAYTIDGGPVGELEFENFNAALAKIFVKGRNIHPGYAKDKMINSMHVANALLSKLPECQRPESTENYEGFFHLIKYNGTVEETSLDILIRDHDKEKFKEKKSILKNACDQLNAKLKGKIIEVEISDQYFNMREKIEPVKDIVTIAEEAMKKAGVKPLIKPIRGGTDGARLSYMGLPCPNIFAGGHNFHGKYEFVPLEDMEKAMHTIVHIIDSWAKHSWHTIFSK